ncbi:hypothetical protein RUM43_008359 [Polyplax serrata]|uniref:Uncharacterized protein n=1 Tax=Polyplax serrata TaxID=468196 RepID=A0AAN8S8D0_POLSC
MYVFYPASRLVGLTFNYREISQVHPFPARNPSVESEPELEFGRREEKKRIKPEGTTVRTSLCLLDYDDRDSKSDCYPRRSVSPSVKVLKSQSESPVLPTKGAHKKEKKKQRSKKIEIRTEPVAPEKEERVQLVEELKNLEVYVVPKTSPIRRTWSKRFKKALTVKMQSSGGDCTLRDMTHPALNETLKSHNTITFKLVKVGEYPAALFITQ